MANDEKKKAVAAIMSPEIKQTFVTDMFQDLGISKKTLELIQQDMEEARK
jgi:hypothetical protein